MSFDTSEVTSVTVTATLRVAEHRTVGRALTGGWVVVADDATRATLTVPLTAGTCEATQPAVTFGAAAVCQRVGVDGDGDAGGGRWGDLRPGCGLTVDVELGETVTVTATLAAAGVAWAEPLTGGWVVESATEATFTVTSGDVC